MAIGKKKVKKLPGNIYKKKEIRVAPPKSCGYCHGNGCKKCNGTGKR